MPGRKKAVSPVNPMPHDDSHTLSWVRDIRGNELILRLMRGTCFGIVVLDLELRILWHNPFFRILTGEIPSRCDGRKFEEMMPESDRINFQDMIRQIHSGVFPFGWMEFRLHTANRSLIWVGANVSFPGGAESDHLMVVMFDISSRKNEERQNQQLREMLWEIRNIAHIGQAIFYPENETISLSPDWIPYLFSTPVTENVPLGRFMERVHEKDRIPLRTFLRRLPLEGSIDFHLHLASGKTRYLHVVGQKRIGADAKPILMIIAQDITAWWESEQRFQRIFRDNRLPMMLVESDNEHIISVNPSAEQYYGISASELGKMTLFDLEAPSPRSDAKPFDLFNEHTHRTRHRLASGEIRDVTLHFSRMRDFDDSKVFAIVLDITDQVRSEQQLSEINRTLEQRIETEVTKFRMQEEKISHHSRLAALGEMASGIAHEINQPLNTISVTLDNLLSEIAQDSPSDFVREKTDKIFQSIQRLRAFIDHIRMLSRVQEETVSEPFSVEQCIRNAMTLVSGMIRREDIDIVLKLDPVPDLIGNPYKLEQVVINLLTNARDAIEVKAKTETFTKRIEIRLSMEDRQLLLEVEDNGIGIEAGMLPHVMEPFFTTKSPNHGTGLGLSISYTTVQELGGNMEIYSRVGIWTLIRITCPIPDEEHHETAD